MSPFAHLQRRMRDRREGRFKITLLYDILAKRSEPCVGPARATARRHLSRIARAS